jgi:opacity protein-like surface antigen
LDPPEAKLHSCSITVGAIGGWWEDSFGQTIPEQDLKSRTFSPDFAIDVGGGAEVNVTPSIGITIDIRYSLGLANILRPYWNDFIGNRPTTGTLMASGFQVLVGAMFHVM